jgi:hypothetical protein
MGIGEDQHSRVDLLDRTTVFTETARENTWQHRLLDLQPVTGYPSTKRKGNRSNKSTGP